MGKNYAIALILPENYTKIILWSSGKMVMGYSTIEAEDWRGAV